MKEKKTFRLHNIIDKGLNSLQLREKIIGLFLFCVILPLITIDGIIIYNILSEEKAESLREAEKVADTIINYGEDIITTCHNIATSVDQNYKVGEILGQTYETTFDYYDNYHKMSENYFFQTLTRFNNMKVKLYTSNETVVSGGDVGRTKDIENTQWFKDYIESGEKYIFRCDYDTSTGVTESKRRIFYFGKLSFKNCPYDTFIRIDLNYSSASSEIIRLCNLESVCICADDEIIFSSEGFNNLNSPYPIFEKDEKNYYIKNVTNLGNITQIAVKIEDATSLQYLFDNKILIIVLIVISLLLPAFVLYKINNSIVYRIKKLDQVFGKRENDELVRVENPEGSDELYNLMLNYNKMVDQVNNLIRIVYKERLKEQEMSIARQKAELLALHSQINPHFMFNALESIRMHSLIKGETETAEMVEKLALMERQYVNWDSDMISVEQEVISVEAYLLLQKYRFGDKLKYEISIDESCKERLIPKLTVVTFVENACVHGMENKTSECFVYLRVYKRNDDFIIEVEDTGNGIDDEKLIEIREKAKSINIEDLKSEKHIGIYNALLRLKMTMGDEYRFDIESEEGIGTLIQIVFSTKKKEEDNIDESIIS